MKKYTLLAALAFSALTVTATPKENTSQGNPQEMDKFITELMGKMTLHEKIGQLNLPVTGNIVTGQAKSSDVAGKIRNGDRLQSGCQRQNLHCKNRIQCCRPGLLPDDRDSNVCIRILIEGTQRPDGQDALYFTGELPVSFLNTLEK